MLLINNLTVFIDKFLPLERELFFAVNGSESIYLDNAMWTYTSTLTWLPMVIFILYIAFRNQKLKEGLLVLGALVLLFVLTDQISSSFFKPLFKRFRPTHHPDFMNLVDVVRDYRGGKYGFISGHSTNSFGLAIFFSLLFKNKYVTAFMIFWAVLNSYTRVYLGVHFISDIIGGLILGTLIGFFVYEVYVWVSFKWFNDTGSKKRTSIYSQYDGNTLSVGIISYILFVFLTSFLNTYFHNIFNNSSF